MRRCRRPARWLFCRDHRWQPIVLAGLALGGLATLGGIYQDIWRPFFADEPAGQTPLAAASPEIPSRPPFALDTGEAFVHRAARDPATLRGNGLLSYALRLLPDVAQPDPSLTIDPDPRLLTGIGIRGETELFLELSRNGSPVHLFLFRSREAAGLLPAGRALGPFDGALEIRYQTLCSGHEPALVVTTRVGSGNFLGLRVVAWIPGRQAYIDLLAAADLPGEPGSLAEKFDQRAGRAAPPSGPDIPLPAPGAEFADGYFTFADLDGDLCKELIVTRGWRAIDRRTRYFSLKDASGLYREIWPAAPLYLDFERVAEQVKDQTVWDSSTKRAFYPY